MTGQVGALSTLAEEQSLIPSPSTHTAVPKYLKPSPQTPDTQLTYRKAFFILIYIRKNTDIFKRTCEVTIIAIFKT